MNHLILISATDDFATRKNQIGPVKVDGPKKMYLKIKHDLLGKDTNARSFLQKITTFWKFKKKAVSKPCAVKHL